MTPFSKPVLLPGESETEFLALHAEFAKDIQPKGAIGWMIVYEVTMLTWEMFRLRRVIAGIIRNALLPAAQNILTQALFKPDYISNLFVEDEAIKLAREGFRTEQGREAVLAVLADLSLDETSIEAEAYRLQIAELERCDKMLSSLERRRFKALRSMQHLAPLIDSTTDRCFAQSTASPNVDVAEHAD